MSYTCFEGSERGEGESDAEGREKGNRGEEGMEVVCVFCTCVRVCEYSTYGVRAQGRLICLLVYERLCV
jgi:hypothetical protein